MKGKFTRDLGWVSWAANLEILTLHLGRAWKSVFLMQGAGSFDT